MNFKQATDALLRAVTLEDVAKSLGSSVQSVRQARASVDSTSWRPPPSGWERAAKDLAERQADYYNRLAVRLSHLAEKAAARQVIEIKGLSKSGRALKGEQNGSGQNG